MYSISVEFISVSVPFKGPRENKPTTEMRIKAKFPRFPEAWWPPFVAAEWPGFSFSGMAGHFDSGTARF
jgi:hypothetical protein